MKAYGLLGTSRMKYFGLVSLFTLSFWSSGLFLIRVLDTYTIWSSTLGAVVVFIVSMPLVYVTVFSVRKILAYYPDFGSSIVYGTLAGVLLMHGLLLGSAPQLYAFNPSPTLMATAWIIWFSGFTLVVARLTEHTQETPIQLEN